jgi:hypothetical protein
MRTLALIFCLLSFQVFGLESNSTAIVRGRLNSNMDANGHSITNVYQIIDTNGTYSEPEAVPSLATPINSARMRAGIRFLSRALW